MGELARQPGCPEFPKTPLELITPRPCEGFTTKQKLVWPVLGALAGFTSAVLQNAISRRPLWAGIQRHIIMTGLFAAGATYARDIRFAEISEKDAVIRHYICLHPEDFPPYERKRYADVYLPFVPER